MGQTSIKNPRKLFSQSGGDPSHEGRITILENNEYKITYFTEISDSTGSITIPTGATILLDQLQGGVDAYVCTVQNGQPTGDFPQTSGGITVDVTSFNALGAYTLSGTPSSYPVALIYILKIKAIDYSNLNITKILDLEDIGIQQQINNKADKSNTVLTTYLEVHEQAKPSTPTNAIRFFVDILNRFSWIGENGYVRTFDGTSNTEDRIYTLPNDSGTIALTKNVTQVIYKDFTVGSVLNGTTSIKLINSALIPANTVAVGNMVEIFARALRSTATGNASNYLYFNTSDSLSGATVIGLQTAVARQFSIQRQIWVRSVTESETLNSTVLASPSDPSVNPSNTAWSILNIDWTSDVYIIQAFANAANGDSTTSRGIIIQLA